MSNQILISSGAKLRDLDDVIIGTDGVLTSLGFNVANGVPKLDENGKILVSQLPNSVMEFKGVWNAATNTPTLANGTGNAGDVYLCNVAGTVNFGAGPITFAVGDYAVYTGTVWARSSGATGTVTSVGLSRDGDALSVTGSPITTSGTINIGFAGTNLQYINGAGNLVTFPDLTVYVPTSRTLTINDVTYDLSANRTWTIDSMIYPEEGIAVSTGTAWGDSIVDNSSNWNTAYNNSIVSAEVTGTTTKTLTLDQQDGGTITASWTDYDTAPVTSVFGRTGAVVAVSGDYTTAQVTESGNLYFTDARARLAISLTTLGTSGAATYNNTTGVLNIPNYTTDLTGYVPYTGATTNVNLGVHSLSAYDLIINHTSGSGVAASITKGGSGEALTVVKSSGSGNAASITGGVTLLSELHLTTDLADAYIASAANWNTAYTNRITSATSPLSITSNVISISQANTSTSGYISSTDWNTFNGKQAGSTNLTSLAALTYASTSFVKMTAAGTFALDTNTYALASALGDYVTLATNQTITGKKTISSAADIFIAGGTIQSFLIDGGASGNGALTLNSNGTNPFAYQTFAQGGVAKFEIGIVGTSSNGSFYINSNTQVGSTGASIFVKKSNGNVGILNLDPQVALHVTGAGTFSGNINAANFSGSSSGTNTGDQTLAGLGGIGGSGNTHYIPKFSAASTIANSNIYNEGNNVSINTNLTPYLFNVNNAADVWHTAIGNVSATGHMLRIGGAATSGTTKYSTLGAYINTTDNTGTLLVLQRDGGNVIIGGGSTVTDSGELLQVKGGGRFLGSVEINLNHNSLTRLNVRNTTAGANSYVETSYTTDATGNGSIGKYSSTTTAYRFITASNTYLFNGGSGDIAILNDFATGSIKLGAGGSNTPHLTIASTGASTFNGQVNINTGVSQPLVLTSSTNNQYLYINSTGGGESMTQYENPTAGSWYTGIRTTNGLGSLTSYHIYSTILANDAFVVNANGSGRFASSVTATSFIKTGGTSTQYLMADGSVSTGAGAGVTLDTNQTITGAKTFSREAFLFSGTNQSLLIDGAGGQAAITLGGGSTSYCYQNFAQNQVVKFEIGIVGTGGNGSLYINRNPQSGETGSSIYIKKSNGFVGINNTDPPFNFNVYNDSDVWHMAVGGATGQIRFGGQTGSGGVIQGLGTSNGVHRPLYIQRDGANAIFGGTTDNGYKVQINGSTSFAYGYFANFKGSTNANDVLFGNTGSTLESLGNFKVQGTTTSTGGFFDTSDGRLKTLVEDNYLLSSIANVKAKLYIKNGVNELGYYAQDLETILPSAVKEGTDGFLSLSYAQVHTAKIAVIEDEVIILKNRVSELETKLQKYDA
jgi:hypothetical protein